MPRLPAPMRAILLAVSLALSAAPQVQPPAVRRETLGTTRPAWDDSRINTGMIAFHDSRFLDFKASFSHIECRLVKLAMLTFTIKHE